MLLHFIMILCLFTFPSTMALGTLQGSNLKAMNYIAKPGCQTHCGNITVPYPFGIIGEDTGCFLDESFYVTCNSTHYDPPKLFFGSSNAEIFSISESELRISNIVSYRCYNRNGDIDVDRERIYGLDRLFTLSTKNKFTVIGCDDFALFGGLGKDNYSSGCIGLCRNLPEVAAGECSGNGCCQTSIGKGLQLFGTTEMFGPSMTVAMLFLVRKELFGLINGASDLSHDSDLLQRVSSTIPRVLDWVIAPNRSCSEATECKGNSSCYDVDGGGYRCRCNQGYEGNPYLDQGCQGDCHFGGYKGIYNDVITRSPTPGETVSMARGGPSASKESS